MIQRKISSTEVQETAEFPDEILSGDNGEEIAVKNYDNREIRIVYDRIETDTYLIITVMKPKVRSRKIGDE